MTEIVKENPNRLVPADVMHELEMGGIIGKLHRFFYPTSGNATIQCRCEEVGEDVTKRLKERDLDGAILTFI